MAWYRSYRRRPWKKTSRKRRARRSGTWHAFKTGAAFSAGSALGYGAYQAALYGASAALRRYQARRAASAGLQHDPMI